FAHYFPIFVNRLETHMIKRDAIEEKDMIFPLQQSFYCHLSSAQHLELIKKYGSYESRRVSRLVPSVPYFSHDRKQKERIRVGYVFKSSVSYSLFYYLITW